MEEISSFGPSVVIAVGLEEAATEELQEECLARKHRLVTAARRSDLPMSLQGDLAIVSTLLPDGDGRKLAADLAAERMGVLLIDNAGIVPLFDAWMLGAAVGTSSDGPVKWLDDLSEDVHVEVVSRAGRLLEPGKLADAVASAASFSTSSGVPVSFVRMRPIGSSRNGIDNMLDRLTSVVGMSTVFYDVPSGERIALVLNGDRRRLTKLLDDPQLGSDTDFVIVEVSAEDDLQALVGRSLMGFREPGSGEGRERVLVAFAPGQDKTSETVRLALHKMDLAPIVWNPEFDFEDTRTNPAVAVIVDTRNSEIDIAHMIRAAHSQTPPIPVLAIADEERTDAVTDAMQAGASDFLVWPFGSGETQAALGRLVAIGSRNIEPHPDSIPEAESNSEDDYMDVVEPSDEAVSDGEPFTASSPVWEEESTQVVEGPAEEPTEAPSGESVIPDEDAPSDVSSEENHEEPESAERAAEIESVFAAVLGEYLAAGESVNLEGLGVMSARHETSRIVHDDQGRTIVEPPRRTVSFHKERSTESDAEQNGPNDS